jgi:DNA-binding XRE family transcriptional regulator
MPGTETLPLTPEQADRIRERTNSRLFAEDDDLAMSGKALQDIRRRAKVTVAELAEAAGTSPHVIKNIESGRTKMQPKLSEALWNAVIRGLEKKRERTSLLLPRLRAAAGQSPEQLAAENTMLAERVAELEARLNDVTSQLAEHIATVRPALRKLEDAAAREGGHILNAGAEDQR